MATGLQPNLEQALDAFAASRGLPSVQAVLNRTMNNKPDTGVVLPFPVEPKLWWIERD